jgi:hypothetical protein
MPPALATAAASAGVLTPPAIGAWIIGTAKHCNNCHPASTEHLLTNSVHLSG